LLFLQNSDQLPPSHGKGGSDQNSQKEGNSHFDGFLLGIHTIFLALAYHHIQVMERFPCFFPYQVGKTWFLLVCIGNHYARKALETVHFGTGWYLLKLQKINSNPSPAAKENLETSMVPRFLFSAEDAG